MIKAVLATLGAISITKAEAEHIVDELVARGEITKSNRAQMVDQLLREAETHKREVEGNVLAAVQKAVSDLALSTPKSANNIEERLAKVEGTLEASGKDKRGTTGVGRAVFAAVIALLLFLGVMWTYLF